MSGWSAGLTNGSAAKRGGGKYARKKNREAHCGRTRWGVDARELLGIRYGKVECGVEQTLGGDVCAHCERTGDTEGGKCACKIGPC